MARYEGINRAITRTKPEGLTQMFSLEVRGDYSVTEKLFITNHKSIQLPMRMNAAKRGIEYITPRINWFLGWNKYFTRFTMVRGETAALTPKIMAIARLMAEQHDLDDARPDRIMQWAGSHSWKTFIQWEVDFKKEFVPTHIEWMLGVSRYYDTYKQRRATVDEFRTLARGFRSDLRELDYATRSLETLCNDEESFRKWLAEQETYLAKKIAVRETGESRLRGVQDSIEEFEDQYPEIAKEVRRRLKESAESD
jgi:hypothetical protein